MEDTVRISFDMPRSTYLKLKKKLVEKYGGIRGSFKKAVIEAIEQWLEKN